MLNSKQNKVIGFIQKDRTVITSPLLNEKSANWIANYLNCKVELKKGYVVLSGRFSQDKISLALKAFEYEFGGKNE